jgi:hypothetical protein
LEKIQKYFKISIVLFADFESHEYPGRRGEGSGVIITANEMSDLPTNADNNFQYALQS